MNFEFDEKREWGRCDFCAKYEARHTINGGLWWICDKCMSLEMNYGIRIGPEGEEE